MQRDRDPGARGATMAPRTQSLAGSRASEMIEKQPRGRRDNLAEGGLTRDGIGTYDPKELCSDTLTPHPADRSYERSNSQHSSWEQPSVAQGLGSNPSS